MSGKTAAKMRKYKDAAASSGNYPPHVLLEACSKCGAGSGEYCAASRTVRSRKVAAQVPHEERVRLSQLGEGL